MHETAFRVLSYDLRVVADDAAVLPAVHEVLGRFRVDHADLAGDATTYRFTRDDDAPPHLRHRLWCGGEELWAGPGSADVLHQFFWHVNTAAFRTTTEFVVIHAGAVVAPDGRAVLLPAASGSGKTTLVAGLLQSGEFRFLSDEAAPIHPRTLEVQPFPKSLTIKEGAHRTFPVRADAGTGTGDRAWGPTYLSAETLGASVTGPASVGTIVFPRYEPGAAVELSPLRRAEAVQRLARNTMHLHRHGRHGFPVLVEVVRRADVYELRSGALEEAVAAIRRVAGPPPVVRDSPTMN